jgi:hypothetical protein
MSEVGELDLEAGNPEEDPGMGFYQLTSRLKQ